MHVAHLKAGALTGETARPKRGHATLVRDFRQRVVLVHELRQLAGTEELFHRSRHRLGVDQVLRHEAFALGHRQAFLDRALNTHQAHTELVFGHFAHTAHTAVAQVIDIVSHAATVTDRHQCLQHFHDIFTVQHTTAGHFFATEAAVELHAAYR